MDHPLISFHEEIIYTNQYKLVFDLEEFEKLRIFKRADKEIFIMKHEVIFLFRLMINP